MPRSKAPADPLSDALQLLSFRARSTHELTLRLKDKGHAPDAVASTLEYLTEAGYLDDERFARELVETRVRNKSWGRTKIAADLRRRGIRPEVAARAMDGLDDTAELSTANAALARWLKKNGLGLPLEGKAMERAARHLKARGFSSSTIMSAVRSTGSTDDEDFGAM